MARDSVLKGEDKVSRGQCAASGARADWEENSRGRGWGWGVGTAQPGLLEASGYHTFSSWLPGALFPFTFPPLSAAIFHFQPLKERDPLEPCAGPRSQI